MNKALNISGDWLQGPVQRVFGLLEGHGFEAYLVGGCVRNALLGVPVNDLDLATNARPDKMLEICEEAKIRVIPTGIDHGTVTILIGEDHFEVTTYRKDVETDGRRAVVAFSDDIKTDAKRRDFTINALYADRNGEIKDPLGGLKDIPGPLIRFIDEADERIREDGLRILRFFRFFAAYGDPETGLDPDGLSAIASNLEMLDGLSAERIGAEMKKLLSTRDPSPALASMEHAGVLARIMEGATSAPLAPLVHVENDRTPRWTRRLAAIGGACVSGRLRLSKSDLKALQAIKTIVEDGLSTPLAAYKFGADAALDAALITASLSGQMLGPDIEEHARKGAALVFPLKGRDLAGKVKPGPKLGEVLRRLEEEWIKAHFAPTREELLENLDRFI